MASPISRRKSSAINVLANVLTISKRGSVANNLLRSKTQSLPNEEENVRKEKDKEIEHLDDDKSLEVAIEILKKPIEGRTLNEISNLVTATENIGFFAKLSKEHGQAVHKLCCEQMTYENFPEFATIFNKGSKGDKFYVLLKGIVGVSLEIPVSEGPRLLASSNSINFSEDTSPADNRKSVVENIVKRNTLRKSISGLKFRMAEVSVLKSGESFGEYALINDGPRTATIKTKTEVHLGVLTRADFTNILARVKQREIATKVDFLLTVNFFRKFSRRGLITMLYHFAIRKFTRGQIIFQEKEESHSLYIIKKGIIRPVMMKGDGKILLKELKQYTTKRSFDLALLGEGQIFGEEDAMFDRKRITSAYCHTAEAEIYIISKRDFLKRTANEKDDAFFEFINFQCKGKSDWIDEKIKDIEQLLESQKNYLVSAKDLRKYTFENKNNTPIRKSELGEHEPKECSQFRELSLRKIEEPEVRIEENKMEKNTTNNSDVSFEPSLDQSGDLDDFLAKANESLIPQRKPSIANKILKNFFNSPPSNSILKNKSEQRLSKSVNSARFISKDKSGCNLTSQNKLNVNLISMFESSNNSNCLRAKSAASASSSISLRRKYESQIDFYSKSVFPKETRPSSKGRSLDMVLSKRHLSSNQYIHREKVTGHSPSRVDEKSCNEPASLSKADLIEEEISSNMIEAKVKVFNLIKEKNHLEHVDFKNLMVMTNESQNNHISKKGFKPEEMPKSREQNRSPVRTRFLQHQKSNSVNNNFNQSSSIGIFCEQSTLTLEKEVNTVNRTKKKFLQNELKKYLDKQLSNDLPQTRKKHINIFLYNMARSMKSNFC